MATRRRTRKAPLLRLQRSPRHIEPEGCVVCGDPAADRFSTFFLEEQYRFCSLSCQERFEQAPPRFIA